MTNLKCATIDGVDAIVVDIESTFTNGLPSFSIVGLGNTAIQESKDRIKSSLLTNEFKFPPKKITINLSPSEVTKKGSHLDCAMALLIALNDKKVDFDDFFVFGELGLDGTLKDTSSIFILILSLAKQGKIKNVLIPKESIEKISKIPNITIYAAENLSVAIEFFTTKIPEIKAKYKVENKDFEYDFVEVDGEKYFFDTNYKLNFADVKGQKIAKRAALISTAGNHNILFEGSPGCGKSMITKRMQYIMPPMCLSEILEKAKIDALGGKEPDFKPTRTFSSPHHTSTKASVLGGTKIGEIALCNNGILFFDELPHFGKDIIEALREPLEDHAILVSRVNTKVKYDTKFLFISAMNPCPCGNLLSKTKECRCSDLEVNRYKNRLSDPFLDRIDLMVTMGEVFIDDKPDIDSHTMHKIVLQTFLAQKRRGQKELNGKLSEEDIKRYCPLDSESQNILNKAILQFSLSFRAINKVLKVARTIADMEDSCDIQKSHILEALSYRRR
ncbi:MAG: YifB family Mg chelatase-like AAA ATPase [Arcobacteraceae bacterium]|nr:YifB family Mg chelatase-like AAA ATPase [Arcobacteraceae bacterium]